MSSMQAVLDRFDASKQKVRQEIREGFFHANGTLRITETEVRTWIAERAVDELQLVVQLSTVIARAGHLIPAAILAQITDQISDEARHYDILSGLVPTELQSVITSRVVQLPASLAANDHWASLLDAVDNGNPYAALVDINIVHEGYSVAAIEELAAIPFDDIRLAYAAIGADEEKHHASGRELLEWLSAADSSTGGPVAASVTDAIVASAHTRARGGRSMSWSWP
jgi:hypothetical protein